MTVQQWIKAEIWEGTSLKVMARMRDVDNALVLQATVSMIRYRCVDDNSTEVIGVTSLTVASVIFDTLQTTSDDASWTKDETGYNFMYVFPAVTFPDGDKEYFLAIEFTDSAGNISILGVRVPTIESFMDTPAP